MKFQANLVREGVKTTKIFDEGHGGVTPGGISKRTLWDSIGISSMLPEWLTCGSSFYFRSQRVEQPRRRRVCSELLTLGEVLPKHGVIANECAAAPTKIGRLPHHLDPEGGRGLDPSPSPVSLQPRAKSSTTREATSPCSS